MSDLRIIEDSLELPQSPHRPRLGWLRAAGACSGEKKGAAPPGDH